MPENYYDPADAIRDLLSEEYEAAGEEIREEEDEELDWNREIWVKGGGGTWQAKQIRKKVQDTARKIVNMSKDDRFSPSLAYNLYAYCDTLHDFVNGDLDEPEDAQESNALDLEELNQLNELFGSGKGGFKNTRQVASAIERNISRDGGRTTRLTSRKGIIVKINGIDRDVAQEAIEDAIGEELDYNSGQQPIYGAHIQGFYVAFYWRKNEIRITKEESDDSEDLVF